MKQIEPGLIYIRKFFNKTLEHTPDPENHRGKWRTSFHIWYLFRGILGYVPGVDCGLFLRFEALQLFGRWKSIRFSSPTQVIRPSNPTKRKGKVHKNSRRYKLGPLDPVITGLVYNSYNLGVITPCITAVRGPPCMDREWIQTSLDSCNCQLSRALAKHTFLAVQAPFFWIGCFTNHRFFVVTAPFKMVAELQCIYNIYISFISEHQKVNYQALLACDIVFISSSSLGARHTERLPNLQLLVPDSISASKKQPQIYVCDSGPTYIQPWLLGGFNPFEKHARQIGNLPQGSGWT